MLYLIIDILIYNFTPYLSFFFLQNINDKDFLYNLMLGFIIDLFILHTFLMTTILMFIFTFLKKYILKINNVYKFYLFNMGMVLAYYFGGMIIFGNTFNYSLIGMFFINSIFILICYKKRDRSIKFFR